MKLNAVSEKHLVQYQGHGKCYIGASGHHYSYYSYYYQGFF